MEVNVKGRYVVCADRFITAHGRGQFTGALRQCGGGEGEGDEGCKELEGLCHDEEER